RLSVWRFDRRFGVSNAAGGVFHHHPAILAILDRPGARHCCTGRPSAFAPLGIMGAEPPHPDVCWPQCHGCRSRERGAMTLALETHGLQKQFGGLKVTRDLSLRIEQGARHALIGPNGAGKTTVINLL